jgi:hypothetical protein
VLCGREGLLQIGQFGLITEAFVRPFLDPPCVIPSQDTLPRVIQAAVCPRALQRCVIDWLHGSRPAADPVSGGDGVAATDGKTRRRTSDRARGLGEL